MLRNLFVYVAGLLLSVTVSAQSNPAAEGSSGVSIWVGAAFSTMNPDYGCTGNSPFSCWNHQLFGVTPYAYANRLMLHRLGAEGEAKLMLWHGPGLTQTSYLGGPRVTFWNHHLIKLNGKFLMGIGHISLPSTATGSGSYFAYAPGATADFRLTTRLYGRVDYEYQIWPSFPGSRTGTGHGGLTPNGLSFGISYPILR